MPKVPPRLKLLDDADQRLSDAAVTACEHAGIERRTIAWREANVLGSNLLEKTCLYSAYCLQAETTPAPLASDVAALARDLEAIHHRHQAAVEARAADAREENDDD